MHKKQQFTHRKVPEDFFVNDPGPLGTVSDTVKTSKPTLNDLQSNGWYHWHSADIK